MPKSLREMIMKEVHASKTSGHLGAMKSSKRLQAAYYWIAEDMRAHCRSCKVCESRRMPAKTMKAALQQYRMGAPMEWVAIDILGPFPESNRGNRVVLVFSD